MNFSRFLSPLLLSLLPVGFLAVMVVAPLVALTFYEDTAPLADVLGDPYMQRRMAWTLVQALASCVLVLLLGLPAAWTLARLEFRGRRRLLRLLMLPFVMPTLVAGMGVLSLFGTHGILWAGWQDTPYLLLYGNVFFNLPVLVRAAYQGLASVPEMRLQTAQMLGAGAWRRFVSVELPVLKPWLAGGLCLVFLYCFSGFGLALLLGGSRYATVEVEIYKLIAYELDLAQAAVLVWLMLAVTASAGLLYARLSRQAEGGRHIRTRPPRPPATLGERLLLAYTLAVLLFCCALPLAAVWFQTAFAGESWQVLAAPETLAALWNTVRFSFMAVSAAAVLGISHACLARRAAWVRGITFLPFMVSSVCVAFGVLLLYPDWTASLPLLVATYALLAYPFVTKDIVAAWDALPNHYAAAARSLGATPFQTACYVTAPLLKPAFRRGLTLAAATCIGEFAATLFLSRPEWETLTTLIYRYLGTAGAENHDKAAVLTAVLMTMSLAVFAVLDAGDEADAV